MTVTFNPFAPGYTEDPYPQYTALREGDPVHVTPFGVVIVSRYDDVLALLRDPALSVEDTHARATELTELRSEIFGDQMEARRLSMLDVDPPDHTRLRRLVSRAFTPRSIADLRPRIEQLVDAKLDTAEADGGFEAIGGLAFPLPFEVISEMLGMPETDRDRVRDLSGLIVRSLEPVVDPEVLRSIAEAAAEMTALIEEIIAWKRDRPSDDLLTLLIDAEEQGDRLRDEELVAQVSLLFIAGHETTVNLIGNGLLALSRHPDQRQLLREDPGMIENAVEEMLRFDSPVQMSRRITIDATDIAGSVVEAGSFVLAGLGAANRDPSKFGADADDFDIGRDDAREHVAFGGGTHFCLGASLARLEAQVAIGRLVERFGSVELVGEPTYNGRINLRGLDRMPLTLRR